MDLNKIALFRTVAERGSISKACREAGLSQPALSLQILALEEQLGARLFERSKRGLQLTEPGKILLRRSKLLEEWLRETLNELQRVDEPEGVVRIGTYTSVSAALLPAALKRFFTVYPRVSIHYDFRDAPALLAGMRDLAVDLAILAEPPKRPDLRTELLFRDSYALVASSREPSFPSSLKARDLARYPLLLLPFLTDDDFKVLRKHYGKELAVSRNPIRAENLETLKQSVLEGLGMAFLPTYLVRRELSAGLLKSVRIEGPKLEVSVYLVSNALHAPPFRVAKAREFLLDAFVGSRR